MKLFYLLLLQESCLFVASLVLEKGRNERKKEEKGKKTKTTVIIRRNWKQKTNPKPISPSFLRIYFLGQIDYHSFTIACEHAYNYTYTYTHGNTPSRVLAHTHAHTLTYTHTRTHAHTHMYDHANALPIQCTIWNIF